MNVYCCSTERLNNQIKIRHLAHATDALGMELQAERPLSIGAVEILDAVNETFYALSYGIHRSIVCVFLNVQAVSMASEWHHSRIQPTILLVRQEGLILSHEFFNSFGSDSSVLSREFIWSIASNHSRFSNGANDLILNANRRANVELPRIEGLLANIDRKGIDDARWIYERPFDGAISEAKLQKSTMRKYIVGQSLLGGRRTTLITDENTTGTVSTPPAVWNRKNPCIRSIVQNRKRGKDEHTSRW